MEDLPWKMVQPIVHIYPFSYSKHRWHAPVEVDGPQERFPVLIDR